MKIKSLFIGLALVAGMTMAQAQIGLSLPTITLGGTNVNLNIDTNWAATAYGIYDTSDKTWGYGGAVLYQVSPNFWAGVRCDSINGQTVKAGVQANLQATVSWSGISLTPFADASTGLGDANLYVSAGTGAAVNLHTWNFKIGPTALQLSAGAVGSYEHVVVNSGKNWNQIVAGPLIQLSF